jgi:hypothetical protein
MINKIIMLAAITAVTMVSTTSAAMTTMAFQYTGNGYNDGQNAAREDAASGQNDNSCNDHFSNNANFNLGNEGYCAGFKLGYAAEMAVAGVTK